MKAEYNISGPLLEICVDSYEGAITAIDAGADRLEVCAHLEVDGLTPELSLVKNIRQYHPDISIMVMIRCRSGDFVYSTSEMEEMVCQMNMFKSLDIDGYVFGALAPSLDIDIIKTEHIMSCAGDKKVHFHRAFDQVKHKEKSLQQLINIGVKGILTSGGPGSAVDNLSTLSRLSSTSGHSCELIVGGGVRPENCNDILLQCTPDVIHASLNTYSSDYSSFHKVKRLKEMLSLNKNHH